MMGLREIIEAVKDNLDVSVIKEGVCVYTFSESGDRLIPILFNALDIKAYFC